MRAAASPAPQSEPPTAPPSLVADEVGDAEDGGLWVESRITSLGSALIGVSPTGPAAAGVSTPLASPADGSPPTTSSMACARTSGLAAAKVRSASRSSGDHSPSAW